MTVFVRAPITQLQGSLTNTLVTRWQVTEITGHCSKYLINLSNMKKIQPIKTRNIKETEEEETQRKRRIMFHCRNTSYIFKARKMCIMGVRPIESLDL